MDADSRRKKAVAALLLLVGLILLPIILTDAVPLLRGPAPETAEWHWLYLVRPFSRWGWAVGAGGLLWASLLYWLYAKRGKAGDLLPLAGISFALFFFQIAIIYSDHADVAAELVDRTLSHLSSGFFLTATEIEALGKTLRNYPAQMPAFTSEHARTHPPGLPLLNWLTIRFFAQIPSLAQPIANFIYPQRCADLWLLDRSPAVAAALGIWAILPMIAAAAVVFPAYSFAKKIMEPDAARLAVALIAVLPALSLFAPKSVQIFLFLGVAIMAWLARALQQNSAAGIFAAGVLFSFATFLSFNTAPLLAFAVVLIFFAPIANQNRRNGIILFGVGSLVIWLLYWLLTGVFPWQIWQVGIQQHYQLVNQFRRYDWWLVWNIIDLTIFAGAITVAAFLIGLEPFKRVVPISPLRALIWTAGTLIVVMDVSGSTRGETGRLWLFLMPFVAVGAAHFLSQYRSKKLILAALALQICLTIAIGVAWRPVQAVMVQAERPQMPALPHPPATPAHLPLGDNILYLGSDAELTKGFNREDIIVTHRWQKTGNIIRPYTIFNHLVNPAGELAAQKDAWSVGGVYPPTCWEKGETIIDRFVVKLPADLPAGDYKLFVGMYDARDGVRLLTPDRRDAIFVAPFTILPDN